MKFRFVLILSLIFLVEAGSSSGARIGSTPKHAQIVTVPFCDLVKNASNYDRKVVRVRATSFSRLDSELLCYKGCDECLRPVFDCETEEQCAAMRNEFNRHSKFDGEETSRVDAFFTGRIEFSSTPGEAGKRFLIKRIEHVRRISRPHRSKVATANQ